MVAHRRDLLTNPRRPRAIPVPCLGRGLGGVITGFGEPIRPLPPVVGPHLTARVAQPVVQRRQLLVAPGGPCVMREMHRIFMAIGLKRLGEGKVVIGIGGVAARVDIPHVPLRFALRDPFGHHFARTAPLRDPEGKTMRLKGVRDARHRAEHRQAIGRIGDRPVDDPSDAALAQERHPPHRVFDIPFQPVQIVGVELKAEIFGHRILGGDPMRFAVALIGAKVQTVLVLPQVIGAVHIADHRHLMALLGGPSGEFGDVFGQEILMAHHHRRHAAAPMGAEPFADPLRVIAGSVDHLLAADIALFGMDDPFAPIAIYAGGGGKAVNLPPCLPRAFGKGLGQLCRVDVPIQGVPQPARKVM